MPTRNVNLSDQQARFIRQSIHQGQFQNASEVVRAGLRLLEQDQKQNRLKLAALRRLATEGFDELDRGEFEAVDPDQIAAFLDKIETKARKSKSR